MTITESQSKPQQATTKMKHFIYGLARIVPIRRNRLISVCLLSLLTIILVLSISPQLSDSAAVGKYRQGRDRGKLLIAARRSMMQKITLI